MTENRFDFWVRELIKIRDTSDYREQRARIEALAAHVEDMEGNLPGWYRRKHGDYDGDRETRFRLTCEEP